MSEKKCPNCGGVLKNAPGAKYCPYCQAEYSKSEHELDFDLQQMKHEEKVRRHKWEEEQEEKRRKAAREAASERRDGCFTLLMFGILVIAVIIERIVNFFDSIF